MAFVNGDRSSDGRVGLLWVSHEGDSLGISGRLHLGTQPTAPGVVTIELLIAGMPEEFGSSSHGECTLSLRSADEHAVVGSLTCPHGLSLDDASHFPRFTATFTATR